MDSFQSFLTFVSIQKLRTPKGLYQLSKLTNTRSKPTLLIVLQKLSQMHCAIWCDAVWEIVSAEASPTKFVLTDHPVTQYNMGAFPGSKKYGGANDPDLRFAGTHTLVPLTSDKLLILTNLSWARNPYQNPMGQHPNQVLMRDTLFNATKVQTGRLLTEEEVLKINFIMKSRAYRFVAASEGDWLFPEKRLGTTHWSSFGKEWLLMPEPRNLFMGGETYVGYQNGRSEAWGPYGHKPWEREFKNERRKARESETLERFQDEFAAKFGPTYRSHSDEFGGRKINNDGPEYFAFRMKRHEERRARGRRSN
ncbi:DUF4238 domain-containing protein [Sphingomicrobium astaxanthinifaciens]|uniref:DUF4238 domain-containing protein n=1 Tax=Sphingomicrobium astaxanthinifaciens TaxID=1227949 RepID=UPI001FCB3AA3|nr:DUF4238 domain-containing protein [Sphingomicrobium astaxanthinifaciens]MCJ7421872.1 DUF4238 domain-containing protein [Sphingomicrobium astaxanthinifaciens]